MLGFSLLVLSAFVTSGSAAVNCVAGTYWHTRGSVDCTGSPTTCANTPETCCCACHPNFYCPGGKRDQPEDPCPNGQTSPANSTSASDCTGGPNPPPPSGGSYTQVHIAYTGVSGEFSVDFVGGSGQTVVWTSLSGNGWKSTPCTSFSHPTIGYMSAGLLDFTSAAPGTKAQYMVGDASSNSSVFTVTPKVTRPEVYAVYGDFGIANDVCMPDLLAEAAKGTFDSVLHVGDLAYDMEQQSSAVGNSFMEAISPFAATHAYQVSEGNHEKCKSCPGVSSVGIPTNNFTEYHSRFFSIGAFGAGAVSGTGSPRYYSLNQGLTHFIALSAEAYAYDSGATFIANQLAFAKKDLAAVDRAATPWVVVLIHKAWWMQTDAYADFNPLFLDAKVDWIFAGHWHYYNRYKPYNNITGEVDTASISADGATYTNPKFPTVIISGASGDRETDSPYDAPFPTQTGTQNYGYGLFTPVDKNKATWSFKTVQADGPSPADYSDSLTIVKD